MMDNAIDDWNRHVIVMEELAPVGEVLIGGQDDGSVLVEHIDELEQVKSGLRGHGQVAQLVNDEHVEFGQLPDPLLELAFHFSQLQVFHKLKCGEEYDFVASLDRLLATPNGQVGFAHAGWTNEDHILKNS